MQNMSKSKRFAFIWLKYSWTLLYLFVSAVKTIRPHNGLAPPTSVCFVTPQSCTYGRVIVVVRELYSTLSNKMKH